MDAGFLLKHLLHAISDFCSQFSPSAWLLSLTSAFAAFIAVTGALLAARFAYRNASKIQFDEAELHRLRERAAERERVSGVLHAIREELIQLWLMMAEDIARPIETLDPKKKLLPYWPCYQSYFSIFDSNAAQIGLIENSLKTSLEQSRNLLDAELGLKKQSLPFIDSPGVSENES